MRIAKLTLLIVILNAWLALSAGVLESLAVTVKLEIPAAEGVPEMAPLEELRVKLAGNEPCVTLQVTGVVPPELCTVAL